MKTDVKKALKMQETMKEKYGDKCVVLFRTADEYELYGNDAIALFVAEGQTFRNEDDVNFGITKLMLSKSKMKTEMARFKFSQLDQVLPKIIRAGHRVCIVDATVEYT